MYSSSYLEFERVALIDMLVKRGFLRFDHRAWARGYVTRRGPGFADDYHGRFGHGYRVSEPCWCSTSYHTVAYYIWTIPALESVRKMIENHFIQMIRKELEPVDGAYDEN